MKVKLPRIFGENMVLQRDQAAPVWGEAPAGADIEATLAGCAVRTSAGPDGAWRADLPPAPAGGPYSLRIRCGAEETVINRVWRGDVWLAGGQSNMELPLQNAQDGKAAVTDSAQPRLHFYMPARSATVDGAEEAENGGAPPRWQISGPDTAGDLSAVAYYAARTLLERLEDVHIGVIACPWGGTYAHCWMSREELLDFPEGRRRIEQYDARIGGKTDEMFEWETAAYQREVDDWTARAAALQTLEPDAGQAVIHRECGLYPWPPPAGRASFQCPGNLYDSILGRLRPYGIRGFWYYQGEQDEEWPEEYYALLTRLIRQWRRDWEDEEKPFLLCQLPMYQSREQAEGPDSMAWPILRDAQARAARDLPGVELAVLADCGEFDNIHPGDKRTPGVRLGLLSLEAAYHLSVSGRPPVCRDARRAGIGVRVRFVHTGGGLYLTGEGRGFQLAGADGVFRDAEARVTAPDTVSVMARDVSRPRWVRYAWYSFGPAELYGGTGLAAAPLEREMED